MNTQQAIAYENAVIESARDWFLGENSIDGVEELALICEHYKINLPKSAEHFYSSENPNRLKADGGHKTLFKVLDKLKIAVAKGYGFEI